MERTTKARGGDVSATEDVSPQSTRASPSAPGKESRASTATQGADPPLLLSKLQAPPAANYIVSRPRLGVTPLGSSCKVTIVTGGPGSGKTVAARQLFDASTSAARAWLTLNPDGANPARFWRYVMAALERATGGQLEAPSAALSDPGAGAGSLVAILNALGNLPGGLLLVIDDLHVLKNHSTTEQLGFVVEHAPTGVEFVITSRNDPALPRERWRSHGLLHEIRERDLAFNAGEASQLLSSLGEHRLAADDIQVLTDRTEGWPAAIQLAAVAMRSCDDAPAFASAFGGNNRIIADLLLTEVLDREPEDIQDFLLRTSVFETLSADESMVMTERTDCAIVLRDLESRGLFVIRVDEERTRYRYHHLLRDLLRSQLRARDPELMAELHERAARHLESVGESARAIRHWIASGDLDRAFALVMVPAYEHHDRGELDTVSAWVDAFPPEYVVGSIRRMLEYAFALGAATRFDEAMAWLERAAQAIEAESDPDPSDACLLDALQLLAFTVGGIGGNGLACGLRAVAGVDRGVSIGTQGQRARPNLARAYLLADRASDAAAVLDAGPAGDDVATMLLAPALRARIAAQHGLLTEASGCSTRAIAAAGSLGVPGHIGVLDALLARAVVLTDRNQLLEASAVVATIIDRAGHYGSLVYTLLGGLADVRIRAALAGPDDALARIDEVRQLISDQPRPTLRQLVNAAEARWLIEVDALNRAALLVADLDPGTSTRVLLEARLDIARGNPELVATRLEHAGLTTPRERLVAELLVARASIDNDPAEAELAAGRALDLGAADHLVLPYLEEGAAVARLARATADSTASPVAGDLAAALGIARRQRRDRDLPNPLTDREQAVLRLLPSRLTNQEIAGELFVSLNTVKTHLKTLYVKLGAGSRADAVERAEALGLLGRSSPTRTPLRAATGG